MIILDIGQKRHSSDLPMAWLGGTDSTSRDRITTYRRSQKLGPGRVRFRDEIDLEEEEEDAMTEYTTSTEEILLPQQQEGEESKEQPDEEAAAAATTVTTTVAIETLPQQKEEEKEEEEESPLFLTDEERAALWYTKKELHTSRKAAEKYLRNRQQQYMKKQGKLLNSRGVDNIKVLQTNNDWLQDLMKNNDEDSFTIRGLEDVVSMRFTMERKARKSACLHAVLLEQERQLQEHCLNHELIRKRSLRTSKEAQLLAQQVAAQDAAAVRGDGNDSASSGSMSVFYPSPERLQQRTSGGEERTVAPPPPPQVGGLSPPSTPRRRSFSSRRSGTEDSSPVHPPEAPMMMMHQQPRRRNSWGAKEEKQRMQRMFQKQVVSESWKQKRAQDERIEGNTGCGGDSSDSDTNPNNLSSDDDMPPPRKPQGPKSAADVDGDDDDNAVLDLNEKKAREELRRQFRASGVKGRRSRFKSAPQPLLLRPTAVDGKKYPIGLRGGDGDSSALLPEESVEKQDNNNNKTSPPPGGLLRHSDSVGSNHAPTSSSSSGGLKDHAAEFQRLQASRRGSGRQRGISPPNRSMPPLSSSPTEQGDSKTKKKHIRVPASQVRKLDPSLCQGKNGKRIPVMVRRSRSNPMSSEVMKQAAAKSLKKKKMKEAEKQKEMEAAFATNSSLSNLATIVDDERDDSRSTDDPQQISADSNSSNESGTTTPKQNKKDPVSLALEQAWNEKYSNSPHPNAKKKKTGGIKKLNLMVKHDPTQDDHALVQTLCLTPTKSRAMSSSSRPRAIGHRSRSRSLGDKHSLGMHRHEMSLDDDQDDFDHVDKVQLGPRLSVSASQMGNAVPAISVMRASMPSISLDD